MEQLISNHNSRKYPILIYKFLLKSKIFTSPKITPVPRKTSGHQVYFFGYALDLSQDSLKLKYTTNTTGKKCSTWNISYLSSTFLTLKIFHVEHKYAYSKWRQKFLYCSMWNLHSSRESKSMFISNSSMWNICLSRKFTVIFTLVVPHGTESVREATQYFQYIQI